MKEIEIIIKISENGQFRVENFPEDPFLLMQIFGDALKATSDHLRNKKTNIVIPEINIT